MSNEILLVASLVLGFWSGNKISSGLFDKDGNKIQLGLLGFVVMFIGMSLA